MQSHDPAKIKLEIVNSILPDFSTKLNQATKLKDVQKHCHELCDKILKALPDRELVLKSTNPLEESKEEKNPFVSKVLEAATEFIDALKEYEATQKENIKVLITKKAVCQNDLDQFKEMSVTADLTNSLATAIRSYDQSVTKMKKELDENGKLVDTIVLQFKAILSTEKAKF